MGAGTMTIAIRGALPRFSHHVGHVVTMCSEENMAGITASWVVTGMTGAQSLS
jgi:flavin reductase (DIM6/NTAB) family NADH-FMN oxidoreductase RutF